MRHFHYEDAGEDKEEEEEGDSVKRSMNISVKADETNISVEADEILTERIFEAEDEKSGVIRMDKEHVGRKVFVIIPAESKEERKRRFNPWVCEKCGKPIGFSSRRDAHIAATDPKKAKKMGILGYVCNCDGRFS